MRRARFLAPLWLGAVLLSAVGCAPQQTAGTSQAQLPPVNPAMARVWFFRQQDPTGGNVFAAEPTISVNDMPIAQLPQGAVFYRDFPPGRRYKFKVQAYGTPTGERDVMPLTPGSQTYLQVQWVPNWQTGSSVGGSSFVIQPVSPEIAQQYFSTLTNLGQR